MATCDVSWVECNSHLPWKEPYELEWARKAWTILEASRATDDWCENELRILLLFGLASFYEDFRHLAWEESIVRDFSWWEGEPPIDELHLAIVAIERKVIDVSILGSYDHDEVRQQCVEELASLARERVHEALVWGFHGKPQLVASLGALDRHRQDEPVEPELERQYMDAWNNSLALVMDSDIGAYDYADRMFHVIHWVELGCPEQSEA